VQYRHITLLHLRFPRVKAYDDVSIETVVTYEETRCQNTGSRDEKYLLKVTFGAGVFAGVIRSVAS
jgi:hypothetical protein